MNIRLPRTLLAIAAGCLTATVQAQGSPGFKTINLAVEAPAGGVVLPSGPNTALIAAPCHGCAPKSFFATATTTYFLNERPASLAELKAAVAAKPETFLTVLYSLKTGELLSVSAAVATPRTGAR